MNRNYSTPEVSALWAEGRETHQAVAVAIHAISDNRRTPADIWEAPTPAEMDHVTMAVQEYVEHGDFEPEADGRYSWGEEFVTLPAQEAA